MKNLSLNLCCLIFLSCFLNASVSAQNPKPEIKKEKSGGSSSGGTAIFMVERSEKVKREPYLGLEPCAKETPEQISEIENAADTNAQVLLLVNRTADKDEWLRACSVYRLGEFRDSATFALPVIIKLLHDEENGAVWTHAETALWKIPPTRVPLPERIALTKDLDVYKRLFGVYSLGYYKFPMTNSNQVKEVLAALIESAKDEDTTVRWLSVMGIRQQGFYGVDTSSAIPVLSELIKTKKINPIHSVRALVPMGENALPAAPLLFDILYNPKNYVKDDGDNNARSYGLYLTTAIALGKIGKSLIPFLEIEIEKQPFKILEVLDNIAADESLPVLYKAMSHQNPKVKEKAIESLPNFTSKGALEVLPRLLKLINDKNTDVAKAAVSKVGSIARNTESKSEELKEMLRQKALPVLIGKLNDENLDCHAVLTIAEFGAEGESAIPAILRSMKKDKGNYCAESALFDLGEAGRKHLSPEKIKEWEERKERNKELFNTDYDKAKPIKPKTENDKNPGLDDNDS